MKIQNLLIDVLGEATYKTKQLGTRKATSPFFSQIIEFQSAPADWSTARSSTVHGLVKYLLRLGRKRSNNKVKVPPAYTLSLALNPFPSHSPIYSQHFHSHPPARGISRRSKFLELERHELIIFDVVTIIGSGMTCSIEKCQLENARGIRLIR